VNSALPVVSSVRITIIGNHARITVWTRGGQAGVLRVDACDVEEIVARLAPATTQHDEARP